METFQITLVSRDPAVREAAARAFDSAPRHWSLDLVDAIPSGEVGPGRVVWGPDVHAPDGAPRFDPEDPATLVALAPSSADAIEASARARMFVVTSVAGGTGASTVALHLARCFGAMGRSCLLLEACESAWLRDRLDLPPDARSRKNIDATKESFALACLPVAGGFKVLLSEAGRPAGETESLSRRAGELFERVVLDVPARTQPNHVDAAGGVLVLSPTRTSLRRAERFLEHADRFPWAIICNRVGSGGSVTPKVLAKELGRAVDVGLPCTPALRDAEDRAELLPTRYRWTRTVMRVAKALDQL